MLKIGDRVLVTNGGCNFSSRSIMSYFPDNKYREFEFVGVMGSLKTGSYGTVIDSGSGWDEVPGLYLIELDDGSGLYAVSGDGLKFSSIPSSGASELAINPEGVLALIQN